MSYSATAINQRKTGPALKTRRDYEVDLAKDHEELKVDPFSEPRLKELKYNTRETNE